MENELYQTPETETEYTTPVEAPAANPVKDLIQKIMGDKKLLMAAAGGVLVLIIALIVIISLAKGPNKVTTPLDLQMDLQNAKNYKSYEKAQLKVTNGLADDEMEDITKILKKSSEYDVEDLKEDFEDGVEDLVDEYGKNYKFYYEIEDKDKIEKDDLKDIEDDLQDSARDSYKDIKDTDEDDIEDLADMLDIKESDAKKLINIMVKYYKGLKSAKITDGYELEVTYYVDGKELDEPKELREVTIEVYKVDGKWVILDDLDFDLF